MTKPNHEAALKRKAGGKRLAKKRSFTATNFDERNMNKTNFLKIHHQLMILSTKFNFSQGNTEGK